MTEETASAQAMAEIIRKQEAALVFDAFGPDTAFALGQSLRQHAIAHGGSVLIDITCGGLQVFRCAVGSPAPNNDRWVRRKRNVVLEFFKSSLLVAQEMKLSGRTLQDFGLSDGDFALSGGGFPLRVKNLGIVGAIVVSGLPQTHDHQLIADTLCDFLHAQAPSVLE